MSRIDDFLAQLAAEGPRTRRAVEQVPDGVDEWQPHERSMRLGALASLVAGMPGWFPMLIEHPELDLNPPGGRTGGGPPPARNTAERLLALDAGLVHAKAALEATTEEHLLQPWRLLVAGRVVDESPRHVVIRDTFMHMAHHRGQLTVYLRLKGAKVPAIYGPSADDERFA